MQLSTHVHKRVVQSGNLVRAVPWTRVLADAHLTQAWLAKELHGAVPEEQRRSTSTTSRRPETGTELISDSESRISFVIENFFTNLTFQLVQDNVLNLQQILSFEYFC